MKFLIIILEYSWPEFFYLAIWSSFGVGIISVLLLLGCHKFTLKNIRILHFKTEMIQSKIYFLKKKNEQKDTHPICLFVCKAINVS